MKKRLLGASIFLILAACASSQSPEAEPILTAALEKSPVEPVAEIVAEVADTAIPTDTAVPAPTVTAIPLEQAAAVAITDAITTADAASEVLLVFERSGGYAGLQQQWTIYSDGRIDMPDGSQQQAGIEQIETLLAAIQSADIFSLSDSYVPAKACCDLFYYNITVHLDEGVKRIETIDDAPKQPEAVTAVLNAINNLLSNVE